MKLQRDLREVDKSKVEFSRRYGYYIEGIRIP